MKKISCEDRPEFIGQIIDIFEDFLEEKGMLIESPEKEEAIAEGEDPEGLAIIYGTDYDCLQEGIEEVLLRWGLMENETASPAPGSSVLLLREVEDGEIYGILTADADAGELAAKFLSVKADVSKEDPEWQVSDILALLPKEWNAKVETPGSIYI
jgi:hypothetical protein